ncbi:hypothetical protein [Lacisediminihabitans profunda]|uniref:Uncharacterized protein n=1 Tax=Lacisediminihabitans profunda TaxID=2594790 RepID=A0A5C8ULV9_9MICO|nr:hypothetical protein [Lacisediminihabitans profunda]TXN29322.1 hypothetical protein FVP33_14175 [Lacisediminihabitans profunda]
MSIVSTTPATFEIDDSATGSPAINLWIGNEDGVLIEAADTARGAAFTLFAAADALDAANGVGEAHAPVRGTDAIDGSPESYSEVTMPWSGAPSILLDDDSADGSWQIDFVGSGGSIGLDQARVMIQEIITALNVAELLNKAAK